MPELVQEGTPEWEALEVRLFRFKMETLEDIMDGRGWVLVAGVDYPRDLPFKNLRSRLYSAAHSRGGYVRVRRLTDRQTSVRFIERGSDALGEGSL